MQDYPREIKAVQRDRDAEDLIPCELKPGEWYWVTVNYGDNCPPHRTIAYASPNPNGTSYGMLDKRWTITGDGENITVSPSIWIMPGKGKENGEWHGYLQNGVWREV